MFIYLYNFLEVCFLDFRCNGTTKITKFCFFRTDQEVPYMLAAERFTFFFVKFSFPLHIISHFVSHFKVRIPEEKIF